ncbi:MAG: 2-hydroxyacid dehydrogenase [Anaerolineae bacterium]
MILNIHLLHKPEDDVLALLKSLLDPAVQVTVGEVMADTAVPHILVSGRPKREHLINNPNLHTLIIPWAGIPKETYQLMQEFPHIAVHNLHHNAQPVAEMVLTLLMAAAKLAIPFDQSLRQHDWTPRYERGRDPQLLSGKTALILGYGAIGKRVGLLCRTLEMQVLATRRHLPEPVSDRVAEIYPAASLPALLPQANALLICLPQTPQTEGLIGEHELNLLPEKAILVNIGRGPIVDERALYEALKNGNLHAAGLDVWYNYPKDAASRTNTPPSSYPFHELGNVVMSPHRGGAVDETDRLRMTELAKVLNTAVRGETLPNRVNLDNGY